MPKDRQRMDKLSYFDTLANLIPGIVAIWGISAVFPERAGELSLLFTRSPILDPIVYLSLAFVAGNIIQFLSRATIEPLLKRLFWHGHLFSEIFLIKSIGSLNEPDRDLFLVAARTKLGFTTANLAHLSQDHPPGQARPQSVFQLSDSIYRVADAQTHYYGTAVKAHTQNTLYSLYRNLSLMFIIASAISLAQILLPGYEGHHPHWLYPASELTIGIAFLLRARQRGEAYVKGLFWSIAGSKPLKSGKFSSGA